MKVILIMAGVGVIILLIFLMSLNLAITNAGRYMQDNEK